jgi:hypothetical protein
MSIAQHPIELAKALHQQLVRYNYYLIAPDNCTNQTIFTFAKATKSSSEGFF